MMQGRAVAAVKEEAEAGQRVDGDDMADLYSISVSDWLQPMPRVIEGVTSFAAQSFAKVSPPGTIWSSSKY